MHQQLRFLLKEAEEREEAQREEEGLYALIRALQDEQSRMRADFREQAAILREQSTVVREQAARISRLKAEIEESRVEQGHLHAKVSMQTGHQHGGSGTHTGHKRARTTAA